MAHSREAAGRSPSGRHPPNLDRPHLFIGSLQKKSRGQSCRPVLNVIELNNMTPNMTLLGAGNGPEPNYMLRFCYGASRSANRDWPGPKFIIGCYASPFAEATCEPHRAEPSR
jgi:hypothetical protein